MTPEDYKEKVSIKEPQIKQFYEKNKSTLYRIPPKVKVRTILFKVDQNASPDSVANIRKRAQKVFRR